MALGYLSRAVRRAPRAAPSESPSVAVRPAGPIRSPLAELDQRLNLEAEAFDPLGSAASPGSAAPLGRSPERATSRSGDPYAPRHAPTDIGTSTGTDPAGTESDTALPSPARPRVATSGIRDTSGTPLPVTRPEARETIDRRARPDTSSPSSRTDRATSPEPPDRTAPPGRLVVGMDPDEIRRPAPPLDPMVRMAHALAAAERWVASDPDAEAPATPVTSGAAGATSPSRTADSVVPLLPGEGHPAAPSAPTREPAPIPIVQIGTLEVEIVPDPAPAAPGHPPAPRARARPPRRASPAPFGWRQR